MRLHFLVEGSSETDFLNLWLPRFLPSGHSFKIYPHRGKGRLPIDPSAPPDPRQQGLLDQLPAKLRAWGKVFDPTTDRVVVLIDLDADDCVALKQQLLALLRFCDPQLSVKFRLAIEELEAFYLSDRQAIKQAFSRAKLYKMESYVQDSVCGTWELFQSVIGAGSDDKRTWAQAMGPVLTIDWQANPSPSFRQFCRAVLLLAGEPVA
jgi:hypothetical protein